MVLAHVEPVQLPDRMPRRFVNESRPQVEGIEKVTSYLDIMLDTPGQVKDAINIFVGLMKEDRIAAAAEIDRVMADVNREHFTFGGWDVQRANVTIMKFNVEGTYGLKFLDNSREEQVKTAAAQVQRHFGTNLALYEASISIPYEAVSARKDGDDKLWFNIDLAPLARPLGLEVQAMRDLAAYIGRSYHQLQNNVLFPSPVIEISNGATPMAVKIYVGHPLAWRSDLSGFQNDNSELMYLPIRSSRSRIMGASWSKLDPERKERLGFYSGTAYPTDPIITIQVALPQYTEPSFRGHLVWSIGDKENIALALQARDSLYPKIVEALRKV